MIRLRMLAGCLAPPGRGAARLDAIPGLSLSLPPGARDAPVAGASLLLNAMPCMSPGPSSAGPGSGMARGDGCRSSGVGWPVGRCWSSSLCMAAAAAGNRTQPPPMQGHGTTTWATKKDVRRSRLFAQRGLVLGSFRGEGAPLRWPGERVAGRPPAGRERARALSSPACWNWRSIRS